MDALERLCQLMDENPNISNQEMAKILTEEGLASSEEGVIKFFKMAGLEDGQ